MIHEICRSRDAVRADDRAPAGPDLRRAAGRRPSGRGGRVRDAVPLRPLRELPRRHRRADHRRLGRARRPRPGHDAHRARDPRVARHVPQPRQPRQGRDHRRRDERRPGRGGRRSRLARGRASAPRVPVPRDRGARGHARGDARDPARPVGRAGRLVVHRRALRDRGRPVPPQAGLAAVAQRRPAAADRRRRGVAALVPDRRPVRRRVQPVIGEPAGRHPEVRGARRDAARRGPRPLDDRPLRDGRDAGGSHDRGDPRPRGRPCCQPSGRRSRARRGSRPGVPAGSMARPIRRAPRWPRSRRSGSSGSCSRTSCPATSR